MTYIEEIEVARKAYHETMLSAKETWVKSPNNQVASEVYSRALDSAREIYDRALEIARAKYLA